MSTTKIRFSNGYMFVTNGTDNNLINLNALTAVEYKSLDASEESYGCVTLRVSGANYTLRLGENMVPFLNSLQENLGLSEKKDEES